MPVKPVYEGNPKHKAPWQPGRKGSLCPADVARARAQELLASSIVEGKKRFAADKGRAFCAHQHDATRNRSHGYPIGWKDVPATVRQQLMAAGLVTTRDLKRYWEDIR